MHIIFLLTLAMFLKGAWYSSIVTMYPYTAQIHLVYPSLCQRMNGNYKPFSFAQGTLIQSLSPKYSKTSEQRMHW